MPSINQETHAVITDPYNDLLLETLRKQDNSINRLASGLERLEDRLISFTNDLRSLVLQVSQSTEREISAVKERVTVAENNILITKEEIKKEVDNRLKETYDKKTTIRWALGFSVSILVMTVAAATLLIHFIK